MHPLELKLVERRLTEFACNLSSPVERRNYALLQAAAEIYDTTKLRGETVVDTKMIELRRIWALADAEWFLAEIEKRDAERREQEKVDD